MKAWLETELEAEQYLSDPRNAHEVARLAKDQTTGFDEATLHQALFGAVPASEGGSPTRMVLPFAFTPDSKELIKRATAFLFEVKSIAVPELAPDAVLPEFTDAILKEHGLSAPIGAIQASGEPAAAR